jgi:hypothetical protein
MIQGLPAEGGQASGCGLGPASAGYDDQDAQMDAAKLTDVWGGSPWWHGALGSERRPAS